MLLVRDGRRSVVHASRICKCDGSLGGMSEATIGFVILLVTPVGLGQNGYNA